MSDQSLRVFISYARSDSSDFAQELLQGLEVAGFEAYLDRHDIAAGEDWELRLSALIESADTVVFVISPRAVASERCAWEVRKAEALSKRIIPVVAIQVNEADTPPNLARLNYIFFVQGRSFTGALGELANALRTDLSWIREHTRLAELAKRWSDRGRNDTMLLRGPDLTSAQQWMTSWKLGAPEITDIQRLFIKESADAESAAVLRERRRQQVYRTALSVALAIFAILATIAVAFAFSAQSERNKSLALADSLARGLLEKARLEDSQTELLDSLSTISQNPEANIDLLQFLNLSARSGLSVRSIQLIQEFEIKDRKTYEKLLSHPVYWPGGGVNIGFGYDLGFVDKKTFLSDWGGRLDNSALEILLPTVGLTGGAARDAMPRLSRINIPYEAAAAEFAQVNIPKTIKNTRAALPHTDELHPDSFGALVSLAYNRGTNFRTSTIPEMVEISRLMESRQFDAIPNEIRNMKKRSPIRGLMMRRESEASLFETGLHRTDELRQQVCSKLTPQPASCAKPNAAQ